jgi:hypothetical protein
MLNARKQAQELLQRAQEHAKCAAKARDPQQRAVFQELAAHYRRIFEQAVAGSKINAPGCGRLTAVPGRNSRGS